MENTKSDIIFDNLFQFDGFVCDGVLNKEDLQPGLQPQSILKIHSNHSLPLRFAYAPKDGLNVTGKAGGAIIKNVLGRLMSISDDPDEILSFFHTFGFFTNIDSDHYERISHDEIMNLIHRIKATIRLMNGIVKRDYRRLIIFATYLLYTNPKPIKLSKTELKFCEHDFYRYIQDYVTFPDLHNDPYVFSTGKYKLFDSFIEEEVAIDGDFITSIESGVNENIPGAKDPEFKSLVASYLTLKDIGQDDKFLIDFYFNFQMTYGIIRHVEFNKFTFYKPLKKLDEDDLSESMQAALLKIARIVVAREINFNIAGIHPQYNGSDMSATWKIENLLQAIYFSIFYLKANSKIYKLCENPNCKHEKYFLIDSTRANKRYCCNKCRSAASQQRYRNKHK